MNHKKKRKLARKMRTRKERKNNEAIFTSGAWRARKLAIQEKVERKQKKK